MPDPAKYDLALRPDTYWEAGDALTALLVNVKGTRRREMIRDITAGRAGAPPPSGQTRGGGHA